MARYVVIANFRAYRDFTVGEVLDTASDPKVAQLVLDGAPVLPESQAVVDSARRALYFHRTTIDVIVGVQPGPISLTRGGNIVRGQFSPAELPVLSLGLAGPAETGSNLVEMRGSTTGFYALWITDTCAIVTNGQVNANARWSPFNNVSPLVGGRAYNVGASDDYAQNADRTFALYIAESNHADLDYFQGFLSNEGGHRFKIGRLGELGWGDGVVATPTESDVQIVHDASGQITVQIGVAHANALRVAEAGASETAMLLRVNRAGVFSLDRVTIGANDSGGAGFKCLRVPN